MLQQATSAALNLNAMRITLHIYLAVDLGVAYAE
tara:strand:+ start:252 stop:353 length:102 start_codon:yes stop_codon:yes gene_type:complete